jgi:hypothetical protein
MNVSTLREQLIALRIHEDRYCLEGGLPNEAYCIEREDNGTWRTYYSERGQRTDIKQFSNEHDACEHLLALLTEG